MLTIDGFLECRNLPRPNKLPGLRKQPGCMHCIQTQEICRFYWHRPNTKSRWVMKIWHNKAKRAYMLSPPSQVIYFPCWMWDLEGNHVTITRGLKLWQGNLCKSICTELELAISTLIKKSCWHISFELKRFFCRIGNWWIPMNWL